ncbi:mannitol dehydrogenase family protein [Piscinibacter gummiphilus]|uniref:Mannitol dehydrogenase family protein n=1 Tax=Piscinibacter gummiphilus TaxID=946333 RepID=A0ABZ0CRK2_9BURK|nr:mannitol dehydrogenase family protein [Piscinibacter gummiphilus]WOB07146.1 mannitol dehydrogenase family protein [Piscinibacter gummiphilus]
MLKPSAAPPILQFGTSRFLQAHVDLFVSQALAVGRALGPIAVVQTTRSAESTARVRALAAGGGYTVRVRGLQRGVPVDIELRGEAVQEALDAESNWSRVRELACAAQVIVSNTGDAGYALDPRDDAALLHEAARVPRSFPAKLVVLLHARWQAAPQAPLSLYPCELVSRNGDVLRGVVVQLAQAWSLPKAFIAYLTQHCRWANSLVDRIVSEAIAPVGAVAEPYALWAIERQPGLVLPCSHESVLLTDELARHERLKLLLLNLGHTFLAERWLQSGQPQGATVLQAMNDKATRAELEAVWADEVLPVFEAIGEGQEALAYLDALRDRLLNPFLAHRLADIAQNHEQKKQRRLAPAVQLARELGLNVSQHRLRGALQGHQ